MIQTINKTQFMDELRSNQTTSDHFSYEGLIALYDYLEDTYEGNYKLDVIGLCCEYNEYENLEEFNNDYDLECESIGDVTSYTNVIKIDNDSFIIQAF